VTAEIRITSRTLPRLRRRIAGMRERAADLMPAWDAVADWFAEQERAQFSTEGTRWGQPWAPLKPATIAEKQRLHYPPNILVRTGELERSLTVRPLSIERLSPRHMMLGTRVPYAQFHQRGTPTIPRRALLDSGPIAREGAIGSAVASWIFQGKPRIRGPR
jgi:phage gpG-like protein